MNKDKEWLKDKIKDEEYNLKYVYDNYVPYENVLIADDVYDLIDQLDEPKITEEQAWNEEIARLSDYLLRNFEKEIGGDRNYETPVDAAIRLLGEKRKPVIPKFVADWYEENLSGGYTDNRNKFSGNDVFRVIQDVLETSEGIKTWGDYDIDEKIATWAEENEEDFIHLIANCSYKDGYEVEKEPQWVVKDDTGYLSYLQFSIPNIYERETSLDKNDAYKFNSKSKADLIADLVTGTVEEVAE